MAPGPVAAYSASLLAAAAVVGRRRNDRSRSGRKRRVGWRDPAPDEAQPDMDPPLAGMYCGLGPGVTIGRECAVTDCLPGKGRTKERHDRWPRHSTVAPPKAGVRVVVPFKVLLASERPRGSRLGVQGSDSRIDHTVGRGAVFASHSSGGVCIWQCRQPRRRCSPGCRGTR